MINLLKLYLKKKNNLKYVHINCWNYVGNSYKVNYFADENHIITKYEDIVPWDINKILS